jgi:PIN domain nuclease of toxin-antitoxin system
MSDYLLDTQAFIWFVENNPKLPVKTKNLLEHKDSNLFVSIASLWEITV